MKNVKNILVILLAVAGLSSCIEEDPIFDPNDSANIIEIKSGGGSIQSSLGAIHPLYINSFDLELAEAELPITISYSGAGTAPKDITVNLGLETQALARYNAWNNADEDPADEEEDHDKYVLLPSNVYSFTTSTVTIPAGQREATLIVKVKPQQLDFDNEYALPISITESSFGTVSGNHNTAIVVVGAKNKLDGMYTYKTSANTSLVPNKNATVALQTIGQYTVKLLPGLLGTYSNEVFYTIDPATNQITVRCPSLGVQEPQDPRSKYDPATKTMTVFWKQGNGGRTFEETFIYKGVR